MIVRGPKVWGGGGGGGVNELGKTILYLTHVVFFSEIIVHDYDEIQNECLPNPSELEHSRLEPAVVEGKFSISVCRNL